MIQLKRLGFCKPSQTPTVVTRRRFQAVWGYAGHLQAEAEELVVSLGNLGSLGSHPQPPKGGANKPSVKAVNVGGTGSGNPPKEVDDFGKGNPPKGVKAVNADAVTSPHACKFWGSSGGCKKADTCKFIHSVLNSKDNRCFGCSAEGHSKRDCPYVGSAKVAKTKPKENSQKGSPEKPSDTKDKVKGKQGEKDPGTSACGFGNPGSGHQWGERR